MRVTRVDPQTKATLGVIVDVDAILRGRVEGIEDTFVGPGDTVFVPERIL